MCLLSAKCSSSPYGNVLWHWTRFFVTKLFWNCLAGLTELQIAHLTILGPCRSISLASWFIKQIIYSKWDLKPKLKLRRFTMNNPKQQFKAAIKITIIKKPFAEMFCCGNNNVTHESGQKIKHEHGSPSKFNQIKS